MALTSTEEALVRQLLDQQAAILSLAGNEATITSKLGATKVTLADLVAASSVADADLLLMRQGTNDKSVTPLLLKGYAQDGMATQKAVQAGDYNTSGAGGTADAITGDYTPNVLALENGLTLFVRAAGANTTTTPTFAPDSLTAKTIVKGNNLALVAGDIAGAGHWLEMNFDSVLDKWVLQNPAYGVLIAYTPAIKAQSPLGIGASTTLDSTHVGRPLYYSGAAAGTLTLPASPVAGDAITVYAVGAGNCTIQRNGAQTIYAQGQSAVTSIVLNTGASVTLLYDGSAWVQAAGNNSVGYGQTWQTVTGSRSINTTYFNTTGRPIVLSIHIQQPHTGSSVLTIGGVIVSTQNQNIVAGSYTGHHVAIVPPGDSYILTGGAIQYWAELR